MQPLPVAGEYTPEFVVSCLEQAGRTLLSLPIPGARPSGFRSNMPEVIRQYNESYGHEAESPSAAIPSNREISRMDQVLSWVRLIPEDQFIVRRVVQCRSLTSPITGRHLFTWSRVGTHLRCDYRAAQRWHAEGIAIITLRLNKVGLCEASGGCVGPGPALIREALARTKAAEVRRKTPTAMEFA